MTNPTSELVKFNEQDLAKINQLSTSVDITDVQAVLEYGISAQTDIADFSDSILDQVKSKDSGYVGEALTDLMSSVSHVDTKDLLKKKSGFFNNIKGRAQRFISRYDKLSGTIDGIVVKLEQAQTGLLRDITLLDTLYDKNYGYLKELDLCIAGGEKLMDQVESDILPALLATAEKTQDPLDTQKVRDIEDGLSRFDKKIGDLRLSRTIAIQSMPQIRLVQQNDQVLVERIQSSILNTIPLWKNQIVIAISIMRQNSALELQREVTNTTNDLLKKNSELLKTGTIGTATEAERGIVELETLQQVNNDLIETITETIRIQKEGKDKRAQAEIELSRMETELKTKLLEVSKQR
jgi:uncharacterized protein YaaN involved in tellurite resistance